MDPLTKLLHTQPFGFLYLLYRRILVVLKIPFWTALYFAGINKPRPYMLHVMTQLSFPHLLFNVQTRLQKRVKPATGHTKEVIAKDCLDARFIWVDPVPPNLIVGEVERLARACGAQSVRIPAYGFGKWSLNEISHEMVKRIERNLQAGTAHPEDPTANIPRGYLTYGISRVLSVDYRLSATNPYPVVASFPDSSSGCTGRGTSTSHVRSDSSPRMSSSVEIVLVGNFSPCVGKVLTGLAELGLGIPGGLILISPWVDPTGTYTGTLTDNSPAVLNAKSDYIKLPDAKNRSNARYFYSLRALIGPMSVKDAGHSPYISPASLRLAENGLFSDFPPSYIISGDAEVLVEQIRLLHSRMKGDMPTGAVVYREVPDAVHDFVAFTVWEPERSEVLREIMNWVKAL
ncbi:Steryl acetyl hydrolase [Rhizoctonia solani]|uniref:Steryl acetyl hydrolase n=1 Tax=Rhizoctonia solani TaxID=456999 RepID=A0A8H7IJY7_9AGAM|nr:Steryl acetyl hydrolase [Rhizoctonia solani]